MKISKGWKLFVIGAAVAISGLVKTNRAFAIANSSATLNIDVTVNAATAVSIDSLGVSSSIAISWNPATRQVSSNDQVSSATVKNPGNLTERWSLTTTATSINANNVGGDVLTWAMINSTGTTGVNDDQFAVEAVFASSATTNAQCPVDAAAIWTDTATVVFNTSLGATAYYGEGTNLDQYVNVLDTHGTACPDTGCNASGTGNTAKMFAFNATSGVGLRALCWRVILPTGTSSANNQIIPIIVTASQN
jgi:hypothetical protein